MGRKRKQLTEEEIWDDSALIDSWNEAYEEYKYYHSLHARGEKVSQVLDAYERDEAAQKSARSGPNDSGSSALSNGTAKDVKTKDGADEEDHSSDEEGEIAEDDDDDAAKERDGSEDMAMEQADEDGLTQAQTQDHTGSSHLPVDESAAAASAATTVNPAAATTQAAPAADSSQASPVPVSGVPPMLAGSSTRDPALKSLLMSWYWAGYYTGVYEGQREAAAVVAQGPEPSTATDPATGQGGT